MSKAADGPGFALGVLSRTWSRVEAGDVDAVHRSRVATRRLREALPLVKGRGRERRRLRRELRRVTRSLGPIRELDVALSLAGTLAIDWPDLASALDQVTGRLHELRARRRARLIRKVSRADIENLVERVEALLAQARRPNALRPSIDRPRLAERIAGPDGMVDAALIGAAEASLRQQPDAWRDCGSDAEVFQYLKQLWHVVVHYGLSMVKDAKSKLG